MDTDFQSNTPVLPLNSEQNTDQRLVQFIKDLFHRPEIRQAVFTFPVEDVEPLTLLQSSYEAEGYRYYWEQPSKDFTIVASNSMIELSSAGKNRFSDIRKQQQEVVSSTETFSACSHPCEGLMFLGGFSFFDEISNSLWNSFEAASLVVPEWLVIKDTEHTLLTLSFHLDSFENPDELYRKVLHEIERIHQNKSTRSFNHQKIRSSKTDSNVQTPDYNPIYNDWETSINKSVSLIKEQKFQKIVLARQLSVPYQSKRSAIALIDRLRKQYPNCNCFLIRQSEDHTFLGATPEKLASFHDGILSTEALAGSIQRGRTIEEDSSLAKNLSFSSKNQKEHQFVVRDIEQRLNPFTQTIFREEQPRIKKLSNVQHLYTPIRAELLPGIDALKILQQLHPTPAVGGYPWEKAAPHIKQLENFDRGWYAGPVGWLNANGDGEFAVAIRSGLLNGTEAHFFAGCGIVADSDPRSEWEETDLKLKPMLSAFQYD